MIKSMTGYGRCAENVNGREITVEVRSVNNRYFDCTVKLPRSAGFAEDAVKNRVKSAITRAKIDVFVSIRSTQAADESVAINKPLLKAYLDALNQISVEFDVRNDVSVMTLSRLPDVFTVEKIEEDEQQLTTDILSVTDKALVSFDRMRCREGQALEQDLRDRCNTILNFVSQVEQRSPKTVEEYRERLTEKMREVLQNSNIDEARILQEAAIYADKIAVDEETVRLRSHLGQLSDMLTDGGAIGKKLDFLLQELNRETNTIGSKCNDLALSNVVVGIKAELEKVREQTQNIE